MGWRSAVRLQPFCAHGMQHPDNGMVQRPPPPYGPQDHSYVVPDHCLACPVIET